MTHMTRVDVLGTGTADRSADHAARSADLALVRVNLETVANALARLWSSALDRGDFDEITRLVEASHAVHLAVVSLTADRDIPSGRFATA
jgi:hypothetical protein